MRDGLAKLGKTRHRTLDKPARDRPTLLSSLAMAPSATVIATGEDWEGGEDKVDVATERKLAADRKLSGRSRWKAVHAATKFNSAKRLGALGRLSSGGSEAKEKKGAKAAPAAQSGGDAKGRRKSLVNEGRDDLLFKAHIAQPAELQPREAEDDPPEGTWLAKQARAAQELLDDHREWESEPETAQASPEVEKASQREAESRKSLEEGEQQPGLLETIGGWLSFNCIAARP